MVGEGGVSVKGIYMERIKTLSKILGGTSDKNILFSDLLSTLHSLGFEERIKGGHHILTKKGIYEIINFQPRGNKAKPNQVKQVRNVILKYKMKGDKNEQI